MGPAEQTKFARSSEPLCRACGLQPAGLGTGMGSSGAVGAGRAGTSSRLQALPHELAGEQGGAAGCQSSPWSALAWLPMKQQSRRAMRLLRLGAALPTGALLVLPGSSRESVGLHSVCLLAR